MTRPYAAYDELFKVVVIGMNGVGKTSLIHRFVHDTFQTGYLATIGVDFYIKLVDLDDRVIKMQIWDTYGGERFTMHVVTISFFRGCKGIILVYDITSQKSFDNVCRWDASRFSAEDIPKLLIGNKSDLGAAREVAFTTGKSFADELGIPFFETSAMDSTNVEQAFVTVVADSIDRLKDETRPHINEIVLREKMNKSKPPKTSCWTSCWRS
ncbi:uncharacterized protein LOC135492874 isoform X2 [Lineus longissimus]|uniref:uncharacterized protein LOC135492874 isoform X2 n=1 Tax=Lineus longissimus TaxID=88925 RepID=UPI002B4CCBAB